MVLGWHTGAAEIVQVGIEFLRVDLLFVQEPVFVVMTEGLIRRWMVAPMEQAVAVVGAHLVMLGRRQMQLADQRAVVTRFSQALGHKLFVRRKVRIAVAVDMMRGRVATGQKGGPCRGADRTLGIGPGERHAVGHQRVDGIGSDMRIAQRMDGVPTLLIRTVPQNVGAHCSHCAFQAARNCASSSACSGSSTCTTTSRIVPVKRNGAE